MSDSEKHGLRLLIECANLLRECEQSGEVVVPSELKNRLKDYLDSCFDGLVEAADALCHSPNTVR